MSTPVLTIGLHTVFHGSFAVAYQRIHTALKADGFEIVAEIDLAELLTKKTGSFIQPHKLIVVCDPELTRKALTISPQIAALLATTIAISQLQEGQLEIRIADPLTTWGVMPGSYLRPLAEEITARLERVMSALIE